MLVLPFIKFQKKQPFATGFSISALSKLILALSGILVAIGLSSVYHSMLYGYTMPIWAVPLAFIAFIPFGFRIRVALSADKKVLYRQNVLFGVLLREKKYYDEGFHSFRCVPTNIIDKQFYLVAKGAQDVSVHYCKMQKSRSNKVQSLLAGMLGV